ncbi:MAG TPA: hypothetical protein VGI63_01285 [Verrucomicrobiae bacterium]|jgi:hypothetical protein
MCKILNITEQNEHLETTVQTALDNFSLAALLTGLLAEYEVANLGPPKATVHLQGQNPRLDKIIPGENCGFFVTPVFQMAALDCRRSLEFFGLKCDYKNKRLTPIINRHFGDLGIESFGLPRVTRDQFLKIVPAEIVKQIESILVEIHFWSNKRLAHFTVSEQDMKLSPIHDSSIVMIRAYLTFLFDALGRPRPHIQPSDD